MFLINIKIKFFKNQVFKNGEFIEIIEKDIEGCWSVFFFYLVDFIFVCLIELGDVVDYYEELQKLGVDVYVVFIDIYFIYKVWYSSFEIIVKIKYVMIGDLIGVLICNFDNMCEDEGLVDCVIFVVDLQGIIQVIEVIVEGIGCDVFDLLCKIKAVQYVVFYLGEVCLVKWKEGEVILVLFLDLVGKI